MTKTTLIEPVAQSDRGANKFKSIMSLSTNKLISWVGQEGRSSSQTNLDIKLRFRPSNTPGRWSMIDAMRSMT
jgi:hypothetical protein